MNIIAGRRNIEILRGIEEIDRNTERAIRQGWFKIGAQLNKRLSEQMLAKNKTGITRKLRQGKRKVRHTASARGETPANFTGKLRRSRGYQISGSSSLEFGFRKGMKAPYSVFLEPEDKLDRPGLGNAVKSESGRMQSILANELREALS